jgi:hypothetical protein
MQVSLGQTNTTALCLALTSHSELSQADLKKANITPTTLRISVGLEDPRTQINHLRMAATMALPDNFSDLLPDESAVNQLYQDIYKKVHAS